MAPLRAAVWAALECASDADVSTLHLRDHAAPIPALHHALMCSGARPAGSADARKRGAAAWHEGEPRRAMLAAYRHFVQEAVLPRGASRKLVYQAEPVLRISLPGARAASGKPRADREFFHQRGERTYWVPLLGGGGDSGALHVAAAPGGDELRALPAAVGECACWDGHDAAAGFVPNQTGAATVGLEFRAIPFEEYREDRERSRRSSHDLRLGEYYAVLAV